eukprot:XP_001700308.1 predicted protein [Chlamydomonas reinhardtii]
MDTQVALSLVSKFAGLGPGGNCFGFAGTKDKRGITTQFVTAFKVPASRLAPLNSRLRGMRLGDWSYAAAGLRLGALGGNTFELLMRDPSSAAQHSATRIRRYGHRVVEGDLVLPLPAAGAGVVYPAHDTGAFIREAAAAAGVYLDRPSSAPSAAAAPHELSLASLSGDYRRLLIRPRHLEYSFTR